VTLRELSSLRVLSSHENIVQLYELIREDDSLLYFVFEYLPNGDLYNLMNQVRNDLHRGIQNTRLSIPRIQNMMRQILIGLHHIHCLGFTHRDIKPENILLDGDVCKIADFGLARQIGQFPNEGSLTEYISTRWYRSPEILLRDSNYSSPIDIFAVGCVMAEMMTLRPLFPGKNEVEQISLIFQMLGTPNQYHWPNGVSLLQNLNLALILPSTTSSFHEQRVRENLEINIPNASPESLDAIQKMIELDPSRRFTAKEILHEPFFSINPRSVRHTVSKSLQPIYKTEHEGFPRFSPRSAATGAI
jgi:MAK-like kinase